MSGVSVSVAVVVVTAAAVLYRTKNHDCIFKAIFMCSAIFISAVQFAAGIEREKKEQL